MALREAPGRRGRPARGSDGLLEREPALRAIDATLEAARAGVGAALLLEGHAGMGKTRLHESALDAARQAGLRVFRAAGAELERNLALGVAGQLLRSVIAEVDESERAVLLAAAPARVLALAGLGGELGDAGGGADLTLSHGLFSILAAACDSGPALLALDDLHWCDAASLEFLFYVVHRLEELQLAVVMTARPGPREQLPAALDHLSAHPRVRVESLAPLGHGAVGELVREALGEIDPELVNVCAEVTGGNPFYLHELLVALAETPEASGDQLARRARTLAPDAVTRSLRVRVGRLGPVAASLARAVAVLGDDTPLRHAAALAGLSAQEASTVADSLTEVEVLLAREPLRFVHPLVRHAVVADIPSAERAGRHLQAARLLHRDGADAERVAAHLLLGRCEGDPWAIEQLREAARIAVSRGVPQSAVGYLERALAEPPSRELRGEVLAELGIAQATAGDPLAIEHLDQAVRAASDGRRRAQLLLALGHALHAQGRHEPAAHAYDEGLRTLCETAGDEVTGLRDDLQTAVVATAALVPALHGLRAVRSPEPLEPAAEGPRTRGQRLALARAATQACLNGETAATVAELCERAWDGGRLLADEGPDGLGWNLVSGALCRGGELERALEVADAALEQARRRGLPLAFATVNLRRGLPLLGQGRISEALAAIEQTRDARRYGWRQFARGAAAAYAMCFVEAGELGLAALALNDDGPLTDPQDTEDILRLYVRARLELAGGRAEDALTTALLVGRATRQAGDAVIGQAPWRETVAEAYQTLGRPDQALKYARPAYEQALRTGVLHDRIRALRVLGACEPGKAGLELLQAACELGQAAAPRLEAIRALVDFGAALRRANRRTAAREPLQQAADAAAHSGARALYERARTELGATGARPRREVLLSGPKSLTPSERRIAELAAAGQSNREISQALFVTPKTVEYHLRNVYRKLAIEGRKDLDGALGA